MGDVVYARMDVMVAWSQGQSPLSKGDVWDSSAALVRERPDLFSAEPTRVRGRVERASTPESPPLSPGAAPVEDASAAPGTKRATRRAPKG